MDQNFVNFIISNMPRRAIVHKTSATQDLTTRFAVSLSQREVALVAMSQSIRLDIAIFTRTTKQILLPEDPKKLSLLKCNPVMNRPLSLLSLILIPRSRESVEQRPS
jgi:hypothetical protein